MLWENKVLELVIEGNKESNALGKKAGRFLAMKRDLDITSGAAARLRDKRLQLAAEIVARRGYEAARKNTKEEVFYQRLNKLITETPNKSQIGENKKRKAARKANSRYLADKATAENKTRTDDHNKVIAALAGTGTDPTHPVVKIMIKGTLSTAKNDSDRVEQAVKAANAIGSTRQKDLTQNQANKEARATYRGTAPDAPIIRDALRTKKGS